MEGSFLAHSIYGYFNNGGGRCYVVRIGADGAAGAEVPLLALRGRVEGLPTLDVTALEGGEPINIEVSEDGGNSEENFKLIFRRGPVEEVFENLSMKKGKRSAQTAVKHP